MNALDHASKWEKLCALRPDERGNTASRHKAGTNGSRFVSSRCRLKTTYAKAKQKRTEAFQQCSLCVSFYYTVIPTRPNRDKNSDDDVYDEHTQNLPSVFVASKPDWLCCLNFSITRALIFMAPVIISFLCGRVPVALLHRKNEHLHLWACTVAEKGKSVLLLRLLCVYAWSTCLWLSVRWQSLCDLSPDIRRAGKPSLQSQRLWTHGAQGSESCSGRVSVFHLGKTWQTCATLRPLSVYPVRLSSVDYWLCDKWKDPVLVVLSSFFCVFCSKRTRRIAKENCFTTAGRSFGSPVAVFLLILLQARTNNDRKWERHTKTNPYCCC